jgi:P-type E1-E2 ATPase
MVKRACSAGVPTQQLGIPETAVLWNTTAASLTRCMFPWAQVLRGGSWAPVSTEELVPGDVFCMFVDGVEDATVPCDALILHGGAVANEASLTGESTPQMKEAAQAEGA